MRRVNKYPRRLHKMRRLVAQTFDYLPPKVAMRLRAEKNRRNLFGIHAPAHVLADMVPAGSSAVDAGANAGLYTYWIAKRAVQVDAFEPHPLMYARLRAAAPRNVRPHNIALSSRPGRGTLHVPAAGYGEASLGEHKTEIESVPVELRTLDSYGLSHLGFIKIDVEGHEEALLEGARQTIIDNMPVVFIEAEERHNPGVVDRLQDFFGTLGYPAGQFMANGRFLPMAEFDLERDQLSVPISSPGYANNFLFHPGK